MPAEATMVGTTYNRLAKAALANAKAGVVQHLKLELTMITHHNYHG